MACLEIPTAVVEEESFILKEILTSFVISTEEAIIIRTDLQSTIMVTTRIQFSITVMTEVNTIKVATIGADTPNMTSTPAKMVPEEAQEGTTNVTEEAVS